MAKTQGQQGNSDAQQPQMTGNENPLSTMKRRSASSDPLANAIYDLIDYMEGNPNFGKRQAIAPRESVSNFATNSEKWKYKPRETEQPQQYKSRGNLLEDFEAGIKDQLMDSIAGGDFKKSVQDALSTFTKEFGFDLRNIGHEAGKKLTKMGVEAFKNSETGKKVIAKGKEYAGKALDKVFDNSAEGKAAKDALKNVGKSFFKNALNSNSGNLGSQIVGKGGGQLIQGVLGKVGGKAGSIIAGGSSTAAASSPMAGLATKGLAKGALKLATSAGPWGLLIAGIVITAVKVLSPALKGFADLVKTLGQSWNRGSKEREEMLKNAQERQKKDYNYLVEQPFKILTEAAEKWANTWDSNLRTIGQTQGYNKEGVYSLYEGYAERLRDENLDAVISATDVIDKLGSVLDTGMSGEAAEEFAYIATKLNAAIPTQDFFGYAESYASVAANAIAQGKSQSEAIAEANKQLEQFASNLLYSSRELSGGFSTNLKNGSSLFKDAVEIAQTAKTYNASDISGTLTSVSAIIGAVAPDLADSLVNNVVEAAIGGNNNSALVALRSLAGVNAGNTEFLRAMATNPKEIFTTLFTNLAQMQSMSPDNYMEVAEGLADVFGIDKAAFARVDFNYLAQSIDAMNVNNQSLSENMALLQSGQTTTSAEQLKAQEINRVILEEGLAYVIDSEAGRAIQQHMWDEQLANAMMQNEFAVSLQGSALSFLEGIRKSMTTLLNFLNPVGFIQKGIANMTKTVTEAIGNEQDVQEILRLGAVGGNSQAFLNLTTRGKDLGLTTSLVEMMGGTKGIQALNDLYNVQRWGGAVYSTLLTGQLSSDLYNTGMDYLATKKGVNLDLSSPVSAIVTGISSAINAKEVEAENNKKNRKESAYTWGMVGKSFAEAMQATPYNSNTIGSIVKATTDASQFAIDSSNRRFEEFLATAEDAAANNMSYEEWVGTANAKGISNFAEALDNFGRTEDELRSYFEEHEARQGAIREQAIKDEEKAFRDDTRAYWDYASGTSGVFQTAMWFPFFGDGQKYDTRMSAVDVALEDIQTRLGTADKHSVIGGIEELSDKIGDEGFTVLGIVGLIEADIHKTFVESSSPFQRCMADWIRYIAASNDYTKTVSKATAWSDLKNAEKDQQTEATLALANALGVFSADELKKLDPQLQTNVLLGEIVTILQVIMQQNNTQFGGLSLPDTLSALGLGVTRQT